LGKRAARPLEEKNHLIQKVIGVLACRAERIHEGQPEKKVTLVKLLDSTQAFSRIVPVTKK
jgi:hypothetical protein